MEGLQDEETGGLLSWVFSEEIGNEWVISFEALGAVGSSAKFQEVQWRPGRENVDGSW